MAGQKMSDYETIRAAVSVEKWAVDKVAACYKEEIDEDMRQYLTMKLIEAIPQFPLKEMEREGKANRDKKS